MTVRRRSVLSRPVAVAATCACGFAVAASLAFGAAAEGRRPPAGSVQLQGFFHRALWGGDITFQISDDGKAIGRVQGDLPATCRDRRDGRTKRAGPDGAVALLFDVQRGTPIRPNGTFSFTAHNAGGEGLDKATLKISGTFYGSNVLGQVTGRSTGGKSVGSIYSSCTGKQAFWARRLF